MYYSSLEFMYIRVNIALCKLESPQIKAVMNRPSGISLSTTPLIHIADLDTPLGPMIAGTTEKGLCLLEFTNRIKLDKELHELKSVLQADIAHSRNLYADWVEQELKEYFTGSRKSFTVPLHMPGNDFARSVWEMLLNIPYGITWTYKEQSLKMNHPKAIRAIAAANGRNRIAIVVPCHRVIGSNGSLTGYAAGVDKKKWLINFERDNMGVLPGRLF